MSVRIIVLEYNGPQLLERCLPSICEAARRSPVPCRVTVLDNGSSAESAAWVKEHCPDVEYVRAPENKILCSYNAYAAQITEPWMILLNNDILVEPGFVAPLVRALEENPKVFFAAPQCLLADGKTYEGGRSKLEMRYGLPWGMALYEGHEKNASVPGPSMQTGFGAFRRDVFLKLGGFDELYLPGTMEDADLCFRAWRAGYEGRYCPDSRVHHMGQTSFVKAFGRKGILRMNRRNQHLFVWKNLRDIGSWLQYLLWLPLHSVRDMVTGHGERVQALGDALMRRHQAFARREATAGEVSVRADREIFEISKGL